MDTFLGTVTEWYKKQDESAKRYYQSRFRTVDDIYVLMLTYEYADLETAKRHVDIIDCVPNSAVQRFRKLIEQRCTAYLVDQIYEGKLSTLKELVKTRDEFQSLRKTLDEYTGMRGRMRLRSDMLPLVDPQFA